MNLELGNMMQIKTRMNEIWGHDGTGDGVDGFFLVSGSFLVVVGL